MTHELPFEFAALARAVNYQRWVFRTIAPYVGRRVLEIGAGVGHMSRWLPIGERLILTESDTDFLPSIALSVSERGDPRVSVMRFDPVKDDPAAMLRENLDTVVSFNVLEHIEDDALALRRLCEIVLASRSPGPRRVITFVPAHAWAYGSIDSKVGHFRRYSQKSMRRLCLSVAPGATVRIQYFNAFGLPGWIINGRILKRRQIDPGLVATYDALCPFFAPIDDFLHRNLKLPLGQSLLAVLEWM